MSYSGDILAIGARRNSGNGYASGHTRVYERDPTSTLGWALVGNEDIDGEDRNEFFGFAVALSVNGYVLACGAVNNDNDNGNSGHVRIFETCVNVSLLSTILMIKKYHIYCHP